MVFDSVWHVGLPADVKEDLQDAVVKVYGRDYNEQISLMSITDYLDLEYYPEDDSFLFEERILPVISLYLKGKISLETMLKAQNIMLLKAVASSIRINLGFTYTDDEMKALDGLELSLGLD